MQTINIVLAAIHHHYANQWIITMKFMLTYIFLFYALHGISLLAIYEEITVFTLYVNCHNKYLSLAFVTMLTAERLVTGSIMYVC